MIRKLALLSLLFTISLTFGLPNDGVDSNQAQPNNPELKQEGSSENQNQKNVPTSKKFKSSWNHIQNFPTCQEDLEKFCNEETRRTDFDLLSCLKGDPHKPNPLSQSCQDSLWDFQMNVTKSDFFERYGRAACSEDLKRVDECSDATVVQEMGGIVFCLLEHKIKVESTQCKNFLNAVARVVFVDYARNKPFLTDCENDIKQLNCGRIQQKQIEDNGTTETQFHLQQGPTLDCLAENLAKLSATCKRRMLLVAEMQSDDYHLDRSLYFACRTARETFCKDIASGEGRVFKCLMMKKMDTLMPTACRRQLLKRQKLRAVDYRVDYGMMKQCDAVIHQFKCNEAATETQSKNARVRLSAVILCLENENKKSDTAVPPECKAEMLDVRRQIMEDYLITPSIVLDCAEPLETQCKTEANQRGGKALHCLMGLFRESRKSNAPKLPNKCAASLNRLMHVVDPSADIRVDTVVAEACAEAIHSSQCQEFGRAHRGNVYPCLYQLLAAPQRDKLLMTDKCVAAIVHLQYIIARDFTLNDQLFRSCKKEAIELCGTPSDWFKPSANVQNLPEQGPITFNCLYKKMREADKSDASGDTDVQKPSENKIEISASCRKELQQVMRMQARRIDMNPLLYAACMPDLVQYCASVPLREEYHCLQKNIQTLQPTCKEQVVSISAAQQENPSLDILLMEACLPMAQRYCREEITGNSVAMDELMECLIKVKSEPGMESKCRAAIEHHQILSLEDFRISPKFSKYCARDITDFCPGKTSKKDVLSCLSQQAFMEVVQPQEPVPADGAESTGRHLNPLCRDQLRFQLLQRSSSFVLDPKLQEDCGEDVEKYCSSERTAKKGVFACLEKHRDDLSPQCHGRLFKREKLLAVENRVDHRLLTVCDKMIRKHCRKGPEPRRVLTCLREALLQEPDFDPKCRRVVVERMRVQRLDYRLDPRMQRLCKADIGKYCQKVLDQPKKNHEFKGQVTQCLKDHYRSVQEGQELSPKCGSYIRQVIVEANLNYHLDPILKNACSQEVKRLCENELTMTDGEDGDGRVTECLKRALLEKRLGEGNQHDVCRKEVLRLLSEAHADVHVDPVLYSACANELRSLCGGVPLGQGQQLSCLLQLREDKTVFTSPEKFSPQCRKQLNARVEMWELSAKLAPPENMRELVQQIHQSKERSYLLIVLAIIVAAIFVGGLCCGRVTKRTYVEMKNK